MVYGRIIRDAENTARCLASAALRCDRFGGGGEIGNKGTTWY